MCAGRRLDLPVVHERAESPGRFTSGGFFWTKFGQIQTGIQRKRTMLDNTRLRIAIQKSGRLSEDSRELLSRCGIKVNLHTQRLIALAENMPIDILRVRDDDIPGLGDGRCCRPRYYRRKRAGRRAAQPPRPRAKTRATSPCAVSTSAAAACRWRLRWMKPGMARRRWTANVSPPLTRTC